MQRGQRGRGAVGVLAAIVAVACALAAHAFGVRAPAGSASPPERQTLLAAVALERRESVSDASAHPDRPRHVTAVRTVDAHVEPVRVATVATPAPAVPSPPVPQTFVQQLPADTLPPAGEATAFGCAAALAYLAAYAAPGFGAQCPAATGGHQATTMCVSSATRCDVQRVILVAEPCAAAYMNEASNSWVLLGVSDAPIDPYGSCH